MTPYISDFLYGMVRLQESFIHLVKAMTDKYDVDEETAREDVKAFIDTLVKPGIIEE